IASAVSRPAHLWPRREQAVDIRRVAREGILALDHLEERLLLTEQVRVGAEDETDRDLTGEPDGTHLHQCASQYLDLDGEARLHGQKGLRGPHGQGGDGQSFDHLVGVVAQDGPVLEGAGLALGAVAHHESALVVAAGVEYREPLAAGADPAPTTAP